MHLIFITRVLLLWPYLWVTNVPNINSPCPTHLDRYSPTRIYKCDRNKCFHWKMAHISSLSFPHQNVRQHLFLWGDPRREFICVWPQWCSLDQWDTIVTKTTAFSSDRNPGEQVNTRTKRPRQRLFRCAKRLPGASRDWRETLEPWSPGSPRSRVPSSLPGSFHPTKCPEREFFSLIDEDLPEKVLESTVTFTGFVVRRVTHTDGDVLTSNA